MLESEGRDTVQKSFENILDEVKNHTKRAIHNGTSVNEAVKFALTKTDHAQKDLKKILRATAMQTAVKEFNKNATSAGVDPTSAMNILKNQLAMDPMGTTKNMDAVKKVKDSADGSRKVSAD